MSETKGHAEQKPNSGDDKPAHAEQVPGSPLPSPLQPPSALGPAVIPIAAMAGFLVVLD